MNDAVGVREASPIGPRSYRDAGINAFVLDNVIATDVEAVTKSSACGNQT